MMDNTEKSNKKNLKDRRTFVKRSSQTLLAGMVFNTMPIMAKTNIFGESKIKLGLVGCGGRGTGALFQALRASSLVEIVALGDVFKDQVDTCFNHLSENFDKSQINISNERKFVGFEAYKQVIESCDAVILATPPGFRPSHFEWSIQSGKHVFMEKPLAVDGPGYRKIIEVGELAEQKKLNVVVGLQFRYNKGLTELVRRIQVGEIGKVLSVDVYYNVGKANVHPRKDSQTEVEYQLSNWHYFNWLWGGQLSGQTIHQIDVINWLKNDYPIKAKGMGGRGVLDGPNHGEIFDHHYVEFEYADGMKLHVQSRQMDNCLNRMGFDILGDKAIANERLKFQDFEGNSLWRYNDEDDLSASQIEQNVFIESILGNHAYVNNTKYGAESSMTTIMGRMAIHSGQLIELDKAKASNLNIVPSEFSWDMKMDNAPDKNGNYAIPKPGITKVW